MKFFDLLVTANKNLMRNKGRTILTALAVFVGSFAIVLISGFSDGINNYIDRQPESLEDDSYLMITPDDSLGLGDLGQGVEEYGEKKKNKDTISDADINKIKEVPGVVSVDKYYQVSIEYITSSKTDKKFTTPLLPSPSDSMKIDMIAGKNVSNDAAQYQIALTDNLLSPLGFKTAQDAIGERVSLGVKNMATSKIKEVEATVTGVQSKTIIALGGSLINRSLANQIHQDQTSELSNEVAAIAPGATVDLDSNLSAEELQSVKDKLADLGYNAMTSSDKTNSARSFFDALTTILIFFGAIALLAASIGIVNTLYMSVQDRTREIGLMKAIGLGDSEVRLIFSLEALMLGFWGSILAIIAALATGAVINMVAEKTFLADLPGFTLVEFNPLTLLVFAGFVMFIALIASLLPARRASKLDPIEALRYE